MPRRWPSIGGRRAAFVEMYRKYTDDFPREARDSAYEDRIKRTYPIHPELFDRLYEEWSSLERFQRTRGVLRLMSTVIHALVAGRGPSPVIMPGLHSAGDRERQLELTQYLQDSWKADHRRRRRRAQFGAGPHRQSEAPLRPAGPHQAARADSVLRRRANNRAGPRTRASRRSGSSSEPQCLGTYPETSTSALTQLGDRATYFYSGSGKYWYDVQANITRTAKDQAERLHQEDVWAEIVRRLQGQGRTRGDFAGVHVCPEDERGHPDTDEARLIILHPKVAHKRAGSRQPRRSLKRRRRHRGSSNRTHRNMVVYLAADEARLEELDTCHSRLPRMDSRSGERGRPRPNPEPEEPGIPASGTGGPDGDITAAPDLHLGACAGPT